MRPWRRFCGLALLVAWLAGSAAGASDASDAVDALEQQPLADYLGGLEALVAAIEAATDAADVAPVRELAARLSARPVATPAGGELAPDRSILAPLAAAESLPPLREGLPRLRALVRAFRAAHPAPPSPVNSASGPDRAVFDELAAARQENLARGEGPQLRGGPPQGIDAVRDLLAPFRDAVAKFFRELFDWLREMFRREAPAGEGWLERVNLPTLVAILVCAFALTLLVLAVRHARRRAPAGVLPQVPAPPATDADPLSRDLSGWQRYARELAAAGRTREAIRAWYHAVLVALYGSGRVTFRKGRTNWELIATLSPAFRWRPRFIELTRRFEREWYGQSESPPGALDAAAQLAGDLLAELEEPA